MTDPDEADLSPEEILREAETAFSKADRLFATGHQEKSIIAFTEALELYSQVEGTEHQADAAQRVRLPERLLNIFSANYWFAHAKFPPLAALTAK